MRLPKFESETKHPLVISQNMKSPSLIISALAILLFCQSCGKEQDTLTLSKEGICLTLENKKECVDQGTGIQYLKLVKGKPTLITLNIKNGANAFRFPQFSSGIRFSDAVVNPQTGDSVGLTIGDKKYGATEFLLVKDAKGNTALMSKKSSKMPLEKITAERGSLFFNGKPMGRAMISNSQKLKEGFIFIDAHPILAKADIPTKHEDFRNDILGDRDGTKTYMAMRDSGAILIQIDDFMSVPSALDSCCRARLSGQNGIPDTLPLVEGPLEGWILLGTYPANTVCMVQYGTFIFVMNCLTGSTEKFDTSLGAIMIFIDEANIIYLYQYKP
jgi:hypothetical protein